MSQGPQAGEFRESLGIPGGTVVEGMFTARQGTHLLDFGGEGSAHAPTFPAAAGATNVGGQGVPIERWGRPVGVLVARDGSLLVSDDASNRIWKISVARK